MRPRPADFIPRGCRQLAVVVGLTLLPAGTATALDFVATALTCPIPAQGSVVPGQPPVTTLCHVRATRKDAPPGTTGGAVAVDLVSVAVPAAVALVAPGTVPTVVSFKTLKIVNFATNDIDTELTLDLIGNDHTGVPLGSWLAASFVKGRRLLLRLRVIPGAVPQETTTNDIIYTSPSFIAVPLTGTVRFGDVKATLTVGGLGSGAACPAGGQRMVPASSVTYAPGPGLAAVPVSADDLCAGGVQVGAAVDLVGRTELKVGPVPLVLGGLSSQLSVRLGSRGVRVTQASVALPDGLSWHASDVTDRPVPQGSATVQLSSFSFRGSASDLRRFEGSATGGFLHAEGLPFAWKLQSLLAKSSSVGGRHLGARALRSYDYAAGDPRAAALGAPVRAPTNDVRFSATALKQPKPDFLLTPQGLSITTAFGAGVGRTHYPMTGVAFGPSTLVLKSGLPTTTSKWVDDGTIVLLQGTHPSRWVDDGTIVLLGPDMVTNAPSTVRHELAATSPPAIGPDGAVVVRVQGVANTAFGEATHTGVRAFTRSGDAARPALLTWPGWRLQGTAGGAASDGLLGGWSACGTTGKLTAPVGMALRGSDAAQRGNVLEAGLTLGPERYDVNGQSLAACGTSLEGTSTRMWLGGAEQPAPCPEGACSIPTHRASRLVIRPSGVRGVLAVDDVSEAWPGGVALTIEGGALVVEDNAIVHSSLEGQVTLAGAAGFSAGVLGLTVDSDGALGSAVPTSCVAGDDEICELVLAAWQVASRLLGLRFARLDGSGATAGLGVLVEHLVTHPSLDRDVALTALWSPDGALLASQGSLLAAPGVGQTVDATGLGAPGDTLPVWLGTDGLRLGTAVDGVAPLWASGALSVPGLSAAPLALSVTAFSYDTAGPASLPGGVVSARTDAGTSSQTVDLSPSVGAVAGEGQLQGPLAPGALTLAPGVSSRWTVDSSGARRVVTGAAAWPPDLTDAASATAAEAHLATLGVDTQALSTVASLVSGPARSARQSNCVDAERIPGLATLIGQALQEPTDASTGVTRGFAALSGLGGWLQDATDALARGVPIDGVAALSTALATAAATFTSLAASGQPPAPDDPEFIAVGTALRHYRQRLEKLRRDVNHEYTVTTATQSQASADQDWEEFNVATGIAFKEAWAELTVKLEALPSSLAGHSGLAMLGNLESEIPAHVTSRIRAFRGLLDAASGLGGDITSWRKALDTPSLTLPPGHPALLITPAIGAVASQVQALVPTVSAALSHAHQRLEARRGALASARRALSGPLGALTALEHHLARLAAGESYTYSDVTGYVARSAIDPVALSGAQGPVVVSACAARPPSAGVIEIEGHEPVHGFVAPRSSCRLAVVPAGDTSEAQSAGPIEDAVRELARLPDLSSTARLAGFVSESIEAAPAMQSARRAQCATDLLTSEGAWSAFVDAMSFTLSDFSRTVLLGAEPDTTSTAPASPVLGTCVQLGGTPAGSAVPNGSAPDDWLLTAPATVGCPGSATVTGSVVLDARPLGWTVRRHGSTAARVDVLPSGTILGSWRHSGWVSLDGLAVNAPLVAEDPIVAFVDSASGHLSSTSSRAALGGRPTSTRWVSGRLDLLPAGTVSSLFGGKLLPAGMIQAATVVLDHRPAPDVPRVDGTSLLSLTTWRTPQGAPGASVAGWVAGAARGLGTVAGPLSGLPAPGGALTVGYVLGTGHGLACEPSTWTSPAAITLDGACRTLALPGAFSLESADFCPRLEDGHATAE